MVSRHFGSVASSTVRNFGIEKLPLVILIAKLRGNMEIFQVRIRMYKVFDAMGISRFEVWAQ